MQLASERALQVAARCWGELLVGKEVMSPNLAEVFARRIDGYMGLLESAWGIIANADWDARSPEWREAAERWRDNWHLLLNDKYPPVEVTRD